MKLSIVTVCYNAEQSIEKTIKSILKQTVPVYEYIIIDGGSNDYTMKIVKDYEDEFKKINVRYFFKSEPDRGISDAFNKGIQIASGDIIGLINSDDELMPETNKILSENYQDADIIYGNCIWVDPKRKMEFISKPKGRPNQLLYKMTLIHPSTFVSKNAYQECGMFNVSYKYCMDKELLYRMFKAGKKFKYINETFTKFKAGGVSDKNTLSVYKETSRMAINYGEPKIKVAVIQMTRYMKTRIVNILKDTPIYIKLRGK